MKINGLQLELTNMCALKCPGCPRTRFQNQWPQHWKNHSLELCDLQNFIDVDLSGLLITLCGSDGDCIYHPRFVEILAWIKDLGAKVSIHTNGSYRTDHWWNEVAAILGTEDQVVFAIDGTPESFTQYRINGDWSSIMYGINNISRSPAKMIWQYIIFNYNYLETDAARQLSVDLGFDEFLIVKSDRFDSETAWLLPSNGETGKRFEFQQDWKNDRLKSSKVDPLCNNNKEHFISAAGHYIPCCYLADYRFYYKTQWGKFKEKYDIRSTTLSQILSDPTFRDFRTSLADNPPGACQFNCPAT